jgi:hypothetical protein
MANATAEFAGLFAGLAALELLSSDILRPIFALETLEGQRSVVDFKDRTLDGIFQDVDEWFELGSGTSRRAAFLCEGDITLSLRETPAVLVDARDYHSPDLSFTLALPYRRRRSEGGFGLRRPILLELSRPKEEWPVVVAAFMAGMTRDPETAKIWREYGECG